ncbi:hypothetical protein [Symmachiella dynata]|nr:hypothetical protein [Symmachiella dynata]
MMSEAEIMVRRVGPRLLTDAEQQAYLQFLLKGASPAVICAQLGVPYSAVLTTLRECAEFRDDHGDAQALLTQNVEAALYTHAMKGSVPAMTLWLRNRPPNSWKADADGEDAVDELERLSDAELLELATAEGLAVPVAFARGAQASGGEV